MKRKSINELSAEEAAPQQNNHDEVDHLFNAARQDLLHAQEKLTKLVSYLQANNLADVAPPVADCLKATIDSVATMDKMANKWQEEANKEKEKTQPGSLNTGITNLVSGRTRKGNKLSENISIVKSAKNVYSFDERPYVKEKLFYERPRSLEELQKSTTFEFERFLPDVEQE